jgi:hypothetical protein
MVSTKRAVVTVAECVLIERITAREVADFLESGARPTIRADALKEFAVATPTYTRGIRVRGVRIEGSLDLSCTTLPALVLDDCQLSGTLDVSNARVGMLSLENTRSAMFARADFHRRAFRLLGLSGA